MRELFILLFWFLETWYMLENFSKLFFLILKFPQSVLHLDVIYVFQQRRWKMVKLNYIWNMKGGNAKKSNTNYLSFLSVKYYVLLWNLKKKKILDDKSRHCLLLSYTGRQWPSLSERGRPRLGLNDKGRHIICLNDKDRHILCLDDKESTVLSEWERRAQALSEWQRKAQTLSEWQRKPQALSGWKRKARALSVW